MSKYTYTIEVWWPARECWTPIVTDSLSYCQGYLASRRDAPSPRLEARLVRSDGRVMESWPAIEEVDIGMVAGWPTWQQYVAAARVALLKAANAGWRERAPTKRTVQYCLRIAAILARILEDR